MKVATAFVGEALEKFAGQAEAESRGRVLFFLGFDGEGFVGRFIQAAPDQIRPIAEVNDTTGESFIHRSRKASPPQRIARIEPGSVTPDAFFVAQRLYERLTKGNAAIFHRVMGIYFGKSPLQPQREIHGRMLGEKRELVIKERNSGADGRFSGAVQIKLERYLGFPGRPPQTGLTFLHMATIIRHGT